jgi:hypothetical protein
MTARYFFNFVAKSKVKAKLANLYLCINDGLLDIGALLLVDNGALGLCLLDVLCAALGVGDAAAVLCRDGAALLLRDGRALLLRHRVVPTHRARTKVNYCMLKHDNIVELLLCIYCKKKFINFSVLTAQLGCH